MNSKIIAGLALATALVATPAAAADLSYPQQNYAYAAAPAFTWTGFYLGANVGYGFGQADFSDDTDGFVGGIQAGYNWQFANNFVLGIEADLQGTNVGSPTYELDYFGTVRARAGFSFNQVLLYGTAGFAYGKGTYELLGLSNSQTSTGWTIGGGGEYAFNNNWSVKAEYLYVDLGSEAYATVLGPIEVGSTTNVLRAGVNYRF